MTGKDLVLFIIKHDLLDVKIDSKMKDYFLTINEAAVELGISVASLEDMIKLGIVDTIVFNEEIYLYKDVKLRNLKGRR